LLIAFLLGSAFTETTTLIDVVVPKFP